MTFRRAPRTEPHREVFVGIDGTRRVGLSIAFVDRKQLLAIRRAASKSFERRQARLERRTDSDT